MLRLYQSVRLIRYVHTSGSPTADASQPPRPFDYSDPRHQHDPRHPRTTQQPPPSGSFHPSGVNLPTHHSYHPNGLHQNVESYLDQQRSQGLGEGLHPRAPCSTATVVPDTRVPHAGQSQPFRVAATTPSAASHRDPDPSIRKLRMNLKWDANTFNVWLELDHHAQAFLQAIQQQVNKRRQVHDWTSVMIDLKTEQQSPDSSAYEISLHPDDLDADWETHVAWLEVNKRDNSPHIFGTVVEGG